MTTSNRSADPPAAAFGKGARKVVVSGYYGFENLGDEAILEELTNELKRLRKPEEIVVLSANPERTAQKFGVRSIPRGKIPTLLETLKQADIFVSGGGGLFQNTKTIGSILFYGMQIIAAKAAGAKVMIYAQGLGPLRGILATQLTREFFKYADEITVRDDVSAGLIDEWKLKCKRTADPVWLLEETALPAALADKLQDKEKSVGLSLRPSADLTDEHIKTLAEALADCLPSDNHIYLLPMQGAQDEEPLSKFSAHWQAAGRPASTIHVLDVTALTLPSQWVALLSRFHFLVGMRLHALLIALKMGVPVVGIDYDPKVTHLLREFQQPILNLTKELDKALWTDTLKSGLASRSHLARLASEKSQVAKNLACQNFDVLARILNTKSGS
ncbi:MAG: polysaccharide pyruvyl transferase CsaB [Candidatus Obscuribacterales bacterium]|jgi:polysaccharide pyruvyl transferase CsaB